MPINSATPGLLFFLFAVLLTGCASQLLQTPHPETNAKQLNHWLIEGKLGFRSPQKNGSAWIHWSQQDSSYQLRLNGPFGAGATHIEGDDHYAKLSQAGQQDLFATSGEELTSGLFGWAFPVKQMSFWVKGLPAPDPESVTETRTAVGLLSTLQQHGWQLSLGDYRQQGAQVLPGRIAGTRGDYAFTLVIKKWQFPTSHSIRATP